MRQAEKKKKKDHVAATIMLCFCLIALTSIFTIKASIDKVAKSAGDLPVTQETTTEQDSDQVEEAESKGAESETANQDAESTSIDEDETPTNEATAPVTAEIPTVDSQDTSTSNNFLCPMDMNIAKVTKDYSMDMVIYNMTLDQYMTHPGIDVEAPMNSGVKSIAEGTVTDIYQDDAYGTTIEITHENGLISKYANLATDKMVEIGDTVAKGQQIGVVGQTALYESMDKCHLHFELYKNGELLNPSEYIDF